MVSLHRMPVITGKPGIRLTLSSFGFSQSPLPTLCREASSCAWRSRLRNIPDRKSNTRPEVQRSNRRRAFQAGRGSPNGYQPERVKNSWSALVAQTPDGHAGGSTEPNAGARQTLRTVWSGGQVCAKPYKSLHIFDIEAACENESPNGSRQTLYTLSFRAQNDPERTSAPPDATQN